MNGVRQAIATTFEHQLLSCLEMFAMLRFGRSCLVPNSKPSLGIGASHPQVVVAVAEGLGTYRLAECSMKLERSGKQAAVRWGSRQRILGHQWMFWGR